MSVQVYVVFGSDPEREDRQKQPIGVELEQGDADGFLLSQLASSLLGHMSSLKAGGTLSLIATRGLEPSEGNENPAGTTATFVVNNPDGDRHVWDFEVQRREADRLPVTMGRNDA